MNDEQRAEFADLIADLMIKHGPDRHCDGYEIIAAKALEWLSDRALLAAFTPAEPPPQETEIMRAPTTEADTVADQRGLDLAIPMAVLEREWVEHAARLRHLPLVEYVRRAINLSLRSEGVDAVLLAQSDDDGPNVDDECPTCGGSGETDCFEDVCACDGGHPCPRCA